MERRDPNSDRITLRLDYGPRGEAVRRIRLVIFMVMGVIAVGTAGYMALLGWSFLDALYMTVITIGTVGYGEAPDLSSGAVQRLWNMALIIGGVAILGYATTSIVALAVEGTVRGYFRERRMRDEIDRLDDHYILCGFGRVGSEVPGSLPETACRSSSSSRTPGGSRSACATATSPSRA